MTARYLVADVFDGLATLEDGTVDLVVTSPPFLALRSYLPADHPDKGKEIGSEATPAEFLDVLLRVTAELRRVLAPHGSICIELGDTYAGSGGAGGDYSGNPAAMRQDQPKFDGSAKAARQYQGMTKAVKLGTSQRLQSGDGWPLPKSLALIPALYRVALAYGINPLTGHQSPAGRWRVRNNVTWCRPNPPVGALGDKWRPATSDVVIACTSDKRYWDDIATRKPWIDTNPHGSGKTSAGEGHGPGRSAADYDRWVKALAVKKDTKGGAPLLDYWEIPPGGYPGAHYAVFPPALVEPLIKAMAPPKVCRTCGEPSRRIVEKSERYQALRSAIGDFNQRPEGAGSSGSRSVASAAGGYDLVAAEYETKGWTECGHGVGCRPTTWKIVVIEVPQGRIKGGKWADLDKWDSEIPPDETRIKRKNVTVVDDIGECHDPSHWRPALILDPFAGSGTTLSVATGHGHDAIGIDLDPRNMELARDRVGPLWFDEVTL